MIVFHDGCGGKAELNVTKFLEILAFPRLTSEGVDIKHIDILFSKEKIKEVNYKCSKCSKELDKNDLLIECDHCGKIFPPNKFEFVSVSGGLVLCKGKCCDTILRTRDVSRKVSLSKILFTPNISGYSGNQQHPELVSLEREVESAAPRVSNEVWERLERVDFDVNTFEINGEEFTDYDSAAGRLRELTSVESLSSSSRIASDEVPRTVRPGEIRYTTQWNVSDATSTSATQSIGNDIWSNAQRLSQEQIERIEEMRSLGIEIDESDFLESLRSLELEDDELDELDE